MVVLMEEVTVKGWVCLAVAAREMAVVARDVATAMVAVGTEVARRAMEAETMEVVMLVVAVVAVTAVVALEAVRVVRVVETREVAMAKVMVGEGMVVELKEAATVRVVADTAAVAKETAAAAATVKDAMAVVVMVKEVRTVVATGLAILVAAGDMVKVQMAKEVVKAVRAEVMAEASRWVIHHCTLAGTTE